MIDFVIFACYIFSLYNFWANSPFILWFSLIFNCLKAGFEPCPGNKLMVPDLTTRNCEYCRWFLLYQTSCFGFEMSSIDILCWNCLHDKYTYTKVSFQSVLRFVQEASVDGTEPGVGYRWQVILLEDIIDLEKLIDWLTGFKLVVSNILQTTFCNRFSTKTYSQMLL